MTTQTNTKARTYFAGISNPDQLQILYRALALQYHPDKGGDTAVMQEINVQYDQARKKLGAPAPSRKYSPPPKPKSQPNPEPDPFTRTKGWPTQAAVFARYSCPGVVIEYDGAEVIARGNFYENREKLTNC